MKELLFATPWLAFVCGAALIGKALGVFEIRAGYPGDWKRRFAFLLAVGLAAPTLSYGATDLKTSVESGNAIIMYLCGVFAAIGIVTAGVTMMAGRPTIAKWAFAGAMVSGLGFAVVKTMWSSFGLTAADVSTFAQ